MSQCNLVILIVGAKDAFAPRNKISLMSNKSEEGDIKIVGSYAGSQRGSIKTMNVFSSSVVDFFVRIQIQVRILQPIKDTNSR